MIEELLTLAKKTAEAAEVYSSSVEETPVVFEANRLKSVLHRQRRRTVLRVVRKGKLGVAQAAGEVDIPGLVERAMAVAEFGAPARFEFPVSSSSGVEVFDPAAPAVPVENMVALGQSLMDRVRHSCPELQCDVRLVKGVVKVRLGNTRGSPMEYQKSFFGAVLEGVLVRGTDMLFVGDGQFSCHPLPDLPQVVSSVLRQLEWAAHIAPIATGSYPVVFTPLGAHSVFFPPLAAGFNGRLVLLGASPLKGRVGEAALSPAFSLWDDATIAFQTASRPWDDEGVPTGRTPLVEEGRVAGFLYDLQTAGLAGARSTGNASREDRASPLPAVTALVVGQGEASLEELIADIKQGLVVDGLIGAEQGNVLGGDFSANVLLGYKVEDGRVVGRVKDTMVSGNIYQALREVVLGREGRWVGGNFFTPPLYFPRLPVSARG